MHASVQEESNLPGRFLGASVDKMNVSVQCILAVSKVNHTARATLMWWVVTKWTPATHQSCFTTSCLNRTGNRKYNKKLMSLDKDGERSFNNYHNRQKSLD